MGFLDFVYKYFDWVGRGILKTYPNIPEDIRSSGMRIHYEVYAALAGFIFTISIVGSIAFMISLLFLRLYPLYTVLCSFIATIIPVGVLVMMGLVLPKSIGASRSAALEQEIPYAVAYLSVMATGGMSPYVAFERLGFAGMIFDKIARLALRFTVMVRAIGWDPLTAFEDVARRNPSAMLKDLVLGYAATIKAGGDIADYLNKKARDLFSDLVTKIRAAGERLAVILESYLAAALLILLALNAMYLINLSIGVVSIPGLGGTSLFLLSYLLLPFLSGAIIYLADLIQYKEPWMEWSPYIIYFGVSFPIAFLLILAMVVPFYMPRKHFLTLLFTPFTKTIESITGLFGVDSAYASSIGLSIALILATLPSAIYEHVILGKQRKIAMGVTKFLRDLVEVRKTGLSPERCIITLSGRDYGVFTKYLKEVAGQLAIGLPLMKIYEKLIKKVKAWRARAFLYILTEAIEIGGGSPETLENMAWFAEVTEHLDREKAATMRTLLVIPYIGAITLVSTIVLMSSFMASLAYGIAAYRTAIMMIMPATVLNVYLMGLIAGKTSTGTVAGGFKHAITLTVISLTTIIASPLMSALILGITGGPT
ncbi:MAG: secretion system protein [Candidatus Methanomethylicota archaeon]|uniref:Secretion system protein n=1 Tax=Thermoproteota archaeon TaxID=2056631 RepID=A0A497F0I7_9CREN|nr:MAG: secretion system protein [Candidatus Verstraetearchaeota archaeon]